MKIGVVGAGAMGSLFGGTLAGNHRVWLVDPWTEHIEAVNRDGLRIDRAVESGEAGTFHVRPRGVERLVELPSVDALLILVKSHATREVGRDIKGFLDGGGTVQVIVTLQNGLGNLEVLREELGASAPPLVNGLTYQGATVLAPGHIRHAAEGDTFVESPDPGSGDSCAETLRHLVSALNEEGLPCDLTTNLDEQLWGKLVINAGMNALSALVRVPVGVLWTNSHLRSLMLEAMREGEAVARARGIELPYDVEEQARRVAEQSAENLASMLQDVLRETPTEVDVINGAVRAQGESLGVNTPVNRVLHGLVRALETSRDRRVSS